MTLRKSRIVFDTGEPTPRYRVIYRLRARGKAPTGWYLWGEYDTKEQAINEARFRNRKTPHVRYRVLED